MKLYSIGSDFSISPYLDFSTKVQLQLHYNAADMTSNETSYSSMQMYRKLIS